jgi:hypothetical protein
MLCQVKSGHNGVKTERQVRSQERIKTYLITELSWATESRGAKVNDYLLLNA